MAWNWLSRLLLVGFKCHVSRRLGVLELAEAQRVPEAERGQRPELLDMDQKRCRRLSASSQDV